MNSTAFVFLSLLPPKWQCYNSPEAHSWGERSSKRKKKKKKKEEAEVSRREQGHEISHHCISEYVAITVLSFDCLVDSYSHSGAQLTLRPLESKSPPSTVPLGLNCCPLPVHPPGSRMHPSWGTLRGTWVWCLLTVFILLVYWVGQKVHLGFSITSYRKTQANSLAHPIFV